jgi:hypothetical protein
VDDRRFVCSKVRDLAAATLKPFGHQAIGANNLRNTRVRGDVCPAEELKNAGMTPADDALVADHRLQLLQAVRGGDFVGWQL